MTRVFQNLQPPSSVQEGSVDTTEQEAFAVQPSPADQCTVGKGRGVGGSVTRMDER